MRDYFRECYQGIFQEKSPETFREEICRLCRNQECVNSSPNANPWTERMSTQVDRLLENPSFADENDPRFDHIRKVDFRSAMREAINLEISAQRGDWEIPSGKDAQNYVRQMQMRGPIPDMSAPPVEEDPKPPADLIDDVHESNMDVPKLPRRPQHFEAAPEPSAPTPEPPKAAPAEPPSPKAAPPSPEPPPTRSPHAVVGPAKRDFMPTESNTKMPSGGIMIGGGPPPNQNGASPPSSPTPTPSTPQQSDPWALPPKPKGKVVPVGGKVVFGGGDDKDKDK